MGMLRDVDTPANQPPPLAGYDVYGQDAALVEAVSREGGGLADAELRAFGARAGSPEAITWGVQANAYPPVLRTHDRYGARIDEVEYHPAYHELMRVSVEHGLHARPWREHAPGAHVVRAARFIVWNQVDAGHLCPISMTYSSLPALRAEPALAAAWEPRITAEVYDPRSVPAVEKPGVLVGMAMTEKQGGSDLRTNTTRAEPIGDAGEGEFVLFGHKWFCSAPMCDAFLTLAQAPGGLTCFWVPRWNPAGERNGIRLQRLKDKLGNRSNASSEIELHEAWARRIGEEGRGVRTIIEMVNHTRLDCALGAAGNMRQAVAQATHHAAHRRAFGRELVHQPLMTNVLADLALESEAATAAALRLARAYDASDEEEAAFRRLATAVIKYWTCKRQTAHVAEALECLGGNGYVEESLMPRLLREAPVNGIWEGSGNVMCLNVLRAMVKEPASLEALLAEIDLAAGADARRDRHASRLRASLAEMASGGAGLGAAGVEYGARRLVEDLALALQGSLLVRFAPPAVADAFCASRLGGTRPAAFGTLPPGLDTPAIVSRAVPEL